MNGNKKVERQLELQNEAERARRKHLLNIKAQINVAEGQKERDILISEGSVCCFLLLNLIQY